MSFADGEIFCFEDGQNVKLDGIEWAKLVSNRRLANSQLSA